MIWWHGTDKKTSERHLKKGFPENTFFARHLEDALQYGGEYVFWVFFEEDPVDYWQYVSREIITPDNILKLSHITSKHLYYSYDVDKKNVNQFIRDTFGKEPCKNCDGRGNVEVKNICPICEGYGYMQTVKELLFRMKSKGENKYEEERR